MNRFEMNREETLTLKKRTTKKFQTVRKRKGLRDVPPAPPPSRGKEIPRRRLVGAREEQNGSRPVVTPSHGHASDFEVKDAANGPLDGGAFTLRRERAHRRRDRRRRHHLFLPAATGGISSVAARKGEAKGKSKKEGRPGSLLRRSHPHRRHRRCVGRELRARRERAAVRNELRVSPGARGVGFLPSRK